MKHAFLALCAVAAGASAHAAITFDFGSAHGALGPTHTYTVGGLSIVATGYDNTGALTGLFGKHAGGDEVGLGLVNDPTHDDEIAFGKGFVQLDVRNLIGRVRPGTTSFITNSTTNGEKWGVFGSNTAGSYTGAALITGGNEASHFLPSFGLFRYYDFVEINHTAGQGDNFLIHSLQTSATPEPATWTMLIFGLCAVGGMARRRGSPRAV
jgi:hypothetical protein